jgi:hypothetical protein
MRKLSAATLHHVGLKEKNMPEFETRVYLRKQCLLSERDVLAPAGVAGGPAIFGALAAIFVPMLIGKALGGISSALKKAGSEKTLKDSGRLPTYLYQLASDGTKNKLSLNPDFGCLLVVRGKFQKADPESAPPITFSEPGIFLGDDEESEQKRIDRLNDNGISVSEIAIAYEARIRISNDETALAYESRFLEVNHFQDGGKKNSLVVSLALYGAGAKEGESALSLALMNLGELTRDTILGPDQLNGNRSPWLSGLGMSEAAMKAIEKIQFPADNKPNPMGVMPVTMEATLAETSDGNKVLLFIADILDASKEGVTKTLSDEILKDPKKAATEAADAMEKMRQDEETAYATLLKAKTDLANLGDAAVPPNSVDTAKRDAAQFEVDRAKRAWCLKSGMLKNFGIGVDRAETCP